MDVRDPADVIADVVGRGRLLGAHPGEVARQCVLALRDAGWHLVSRPVLERTSYLPQAPSGIGEEIRASCQVDGTVIDERAVLSVREITAASSPYIIEARCAQVARDFLFALGHQLGMPSAKDPYCEGGG